jgi:multicomponent K+:H+ antiporter subunit E
MKTLFFMAWLLLGGTLALAQPVAGLALAFGLAALHRLLGPDAGPRRMRPVASAGLVALVAWDIVLSTLAVARTVFSPDRGRRAGFLEIPLDTRHPGALAALSVIVTSTPGTTWVGYDPQRSVLTMHVLDLRDEATAVREFKARYERPLREIFE